MNADEALLGKLNKAVAAHNEAEKSVATAQAKLVSHSKEVGQLLLEAKKRHPKVVDFEAFLKRVDGLKLSRAYDCMRIAGGRTTDEEIRKDTRERVKKHRAKLPARGRSPGFEALCAKAESLDHALRWDGMGQGYTLIDAEGKEVRGFFNLREGHEYLKSLPIAKTKPASQPKPEPLKLSVTEPRVTESPEVSVDQRRRENANLGMTAAERSKQNLEWFAVACREYLPNITIETHRQEARRLVAELTSSKQTEAA